MTAKQPEINCIYVCVCFYIYLFLSGGGDPLYHTTLEFYFIYIFLYSRFLLVIHFIHISVYMPIPISQFIPLPPPIPCPTFPPLVSIHLFSTSVSLFLPCKPVQLYHFSRFHIYALIYDIFFLCLTYFTQYDSL